MAHSGTVYGAFWYMAGIVLLQAVAMPLIFGQGWAMTGLTIYLGIAAIFAGIAIMESRAPAGSRAEEEKGVLAAAREKLFRNRWMRWLFVVSSNLIAAAAWPVYLIYFLFLQIRRPDIARAVVQKKELALGFFDALYPSAVFLSIWVVLVSLAMFAVIDLRGSEPAIFDMVAGLIIALIALMHVTQLLTPQSQQARLRRARGPVVVNFVILTVGDLVALLLCYDILIGSLTGGMPSRADLNAIYVGMLPFKDILGVVLAPPQGWQAWAMGTSGLLWFLALARDILDFRGRSRTMTDRCARTFALAYCGFEAEARAEFVSLLPENFLDTKIAAEAALMLGDRGKALHLTRRYVQSNGEDSDVEDMARVILLMDEATYRGDEPHHMAETLAFLESRDLDPLQVLFAMLTGAQNGIAGALERDTGSGLLLPKVYLWWVKGRRWEAITGFNRLTPPRPGTTFTAADAAWAVLGLAMLEILSESEEDFARRVKQWLGENDEPIRTLIATEARFIVLYVISWFLTITAGALRDRDLGLDPVLDLAMVARERMELSPPTEGYVEHLDAWRRQHCPDPVRVLAAPPAVPALPAPQL